MSNDRPISPRVALRMVAALGGAALLTACAAFSPDGGMDLVSGIASEELKKDVFVIRTPEQASAVRAHVQHLLRRPLTADAAVQVALLANRGLQAAYNELGIAEAVMVGASLPPNPVVSFEQISVHSNSRSSGASSRNILALATLPARAEIAADRFRQAQLRAGEATLRIAAETRRAYYRAVAARELVGFLAQAQTAADTASQLAKRLGESGAHEQARSGARACVLRRSHRAACARAADARQANASGSSVCWECGGRTSISSCRARCRHCRGGRGGCRRSRSMRSAAASICASCASRSRRSPSPTGCRTPRGSSICWRSPASTRPRFDRETGQSSPERGFAAEFQIPLFDSGEVRVRQAEQTYLQAVNRLTERAVNVRSEARDAYRNYRSTYDIAMHYRREVLPLRKIISDETLLRYNAMQIDVFALLAEARLRTAATVAAIEAQRDFWLAAVDLTTAVVGGGMSASQSRRFTRG